MSVFIELSTNALDDNFRRMRDKTQGGDGSRSARAGRSVVRRPVRGLEIKDDTYATFKVVKSNGEAVPLLDSSSPNGLNTCGYSNFILQSVQEARMEKHQIIETFGASYVFFFGEQPRFLDCSATLVNSNDFNWEAEWWANYNTYLRGTKLVEMGARCYLSYDDNIIEGYMMMAQAMKTSDQPMMVQLSFKFFVTNCANISMVGDPNFPIRSSVMLPDGIALTSSDAGRMLVTNLQNEALAAAQANAYDSQGQLVQSLLGNGSLGAGRSLSQLVRDTPATVAVSASWWTAIQTASRSGDFDLYKMATHAGMALRGLIASNTDEYVGWSAPNITNLDSPSDTLSMLQRMTRTEQECTDLFNTAIDYLMCYGADINDPMLLQGLGMQPYFSNGKADAASYRPAVAASYGYTAGVGVGLGAIAGGGFGGNTSETQSWSYSKSWSTKTPGTPSNVQNSLSVVYGRPSSATPGFGMDTQYLTETGADYNYGYCSDYAQRPGFGKVGFGDFGGNGYGSGIAAGDPGFLPPSRFTYAGVSDNRGAFDRFLTPRNDRTALTAGGVAGRGVLSGGAAVSVGGKVSAFAMVSTPGNLFPGGDARMQPEYMSNNLANMQNGYGLASLYGGTCSSPGLGGTAEFIPGIGYQVGAGASLTSGTGFTPVARAGASARVSASVGARIGF